MITDDLTSIDEWITYLGRNRIPILAHSKTQLATLAQKGEQITIHELANIVRSDALLSLRTLRYLQSHRSAHQITDVTTVDRAILMVGVNPLMDEFHDLPTIEDSLKDYPQALKQTYIILQRSQHAAACAGSWASYRHDIDSSEVFTAALLHDIAECLVACFTPTRIMRIHAMQQMDHRLRSAIAQKVVLGFPCIDLQLALVEQWHLPPVLKILMDERIADHPRVRTVSSAVSYARHAANGWDDAALPDDYLAVSELINQPIEKAVHIAHAISIKCAAQWSWCAAPFQPPPGYTDINSDDA